MVSFTEAVDPEAVGAAEVWADNDDSSAMPALMSVLPLLVLSSCLFLVTSSSAELAAAATNASRSRLRSKRPSVLIALLTDSLGTIRLVPVLLFCDAPPLRPEAIVSISLEAPAALTVVVARGATGVTWRERKRNRARAHPDVVN